MYTARSKQISGGRSRRTKGRRSRSRSRSRRRTKGRRSRSRSRSTGKYYCRMDRGNKVCRLKNPPKISSKPKPRVLKRPRPSSGDGKNVTQIMDAINDANHSRIRQLVTSAVKNESVSDVEKLISTLLRKYKVDISIQLKGPWNLKVNNAIRKGSFKLNNFDGSESSWRSTMSRNLGGLMVNMSEIVNNIIPRGRVSIVKNIYNILSIDY
jgi:hypothetical protein